ncbi:MAG: TonB-dependent receptor [SAR86 cluster bacterium]|uniref:TonB-dependent receptor n=1 Tax=SAR86 cluster bacterium TaxID=2030880 RepID=A0A2A5B786_9GAMM|nr:MAG: TonB-dependent receptor [SAR86 cluster bacterium]
MFKLNKKASAWSMAFAAMATAGALGTAPTVSAQDGLIEEVVVTGSRIRRSDASSISPISVLTEADMLAAGNLTLENFLQDMPSVNGGDFGAGVNNGNPGLATVSLRGLGPNRTLVLVDGKRPAAAATGGFVDLNMIPTAIVERIEILRDGASTVYGSDAIAGVVNIITKKNFEGVDIDYGYDITGEDDGAQHNFAITFGSTFDRGNFVMSAQMTKRDDIGQGDRSFSACPLFEQGSSIICGGSPTTTPARYAPQIDAVGAQVLDGGVSRAFDPAADAFNYAAVSYLQTPQDIFSAYAATNYELFDSSPFGAVTASLDLNYSNRESDQLLAPIGTFWAPLVPSTHPNNPFGDALCATNSQCTTPQSVSVSRRLTESGGRRFTQDVNTWRIGLGLDGQLDNGWAWDVSYNLAKWEDGRRNFGRAVRPAIEEMLDPALCAASTTGCPGIWNPFIVDSMTAEQDRFGFTAVNTKNDSTLNIFQANLTGNMAFELPGGNIGWAIGYENRRESASSNPDGGASIGAIIYTPGETTAGNYEVDEFYGELVLPILSGVPMAEVLTVEASARYTDVDFLSHSDTVFKVAVEWAPIADVRFRATFAEGFRAPNIGELFLGQQQSAETYTDPCRQYGAAGANATVVANCQADGLAPDFNLATFQATTLQGGNPNLEPETSESTTFGVVIQPSAIENLTISVDYYDIEITDAVGSAPTSEVISACYASPGFSDPLCALIVGPAFPGVDETPSTTAPLRRNANQQLSGIIQSQANLASYNTSGIDFQVDYGFDVALGTVSLRATGTYLKEYDYLPFAGGNVVELASYFGGDPAYGNPAAFSEWQTNYSATLNGDNWGVNIGAKYMSEVEDIAASPANLVNKADDMLYWDLQGYYDWNDITFTAGVRNLTDEEPPYVTAYDDMNTLQFSYDTLGRYFYTRVQFNF